MKLIKITVLILILTLLSLGCENNRELGDACALLRPVSENVTKIEQKNLDCMTVDSDALCISYAGNNSYCTQKCGPARTCDDVQCRSFESCIAAICVDKDLVCSAENLEGQCEEGFKCESGVCASTCELGQEFIAGSCKPMIDKCSPQNLEGICATGLKCSDKGKCVNTGCPSNYICESPIQLLGHPLKGMHVCVKENELRSDPCREVACSQHGLCDVKDGNALCQCNPGYSPSDDGSDCIIDATE